MLWFISMQKVKLYFKKNLNTSYVMVHRALVNGLQLVLQFKYILCYGSSQKNAA